MTKLPTPTSNRSRGRRRTPKQAFEPEQARAGSSFAPRQQRFIPVVLSFSRLAGVVLLSVFGTAGCASESGTGEADGLGGETGTRSTEQEFRSIAGLGADHEDLTDVALSFMSSSVVANLGDENEATDSGSTQLKSEYHFDNCRFRESSLRLRTHYETLVERMDPSSFNDEGAQQVFGRIIHAMQDFYSHTNWAERQWQLGTSEIMSFGDFVPVVLDPGMSVGAGLFVLQSGIPSNWTITGFLSEWDKVPEIDAWNGSQWQRVGQGLMSGTYSDNTDSPACVSGASLPHGDHIYDWDDEPVLAKDSPDTIHHDLAKTLARSQTREEFCRASRLVTLRYGIKGRDTLNSKWGVSAGEYSQYCGTSTRKVAGLIAAALF